MKITARFFEEIAGSDDPRAIQGGGGNMWRFVETRTASAWLIEAYAKAYANKYGDVLRVQIVRAA